MTINLVHQSGLHPDHSTLYNLFLTEDTDATSNYYPQRTIAATTKIPLLSHFCHFDDIMSILHYKTYDSKQPEADVFTPQTKTNQ